MGLRSLEYLKLTYNQIDSFEIKTQDDGVIVIKNEANLSEEKMELVQEYLFVDLRNLSILRLDGNKFEKLDLNCFCNLESLLGLVLIGNQINELNAYSEFDNLSRISDLDLRNNQLTHIDIEAFSEARELARIDLSGNKLESLDDGFFRPFCKLKWLYLQNNNLSMTITRDTFGDKLEFIDVTNNKMIQVTEDAFARYDNFQSLCLHMPSDETSKLIGLPSLTVLELQGSNPEFLGCLISCEINQKSLSKITELSLTSCSIQLLHDLRLGQYCPNLQKLDLSKNLLDTISSSYWKNMSKLEELNLSSNRIESLDEPELFKSLSALKRLNLSHNKLKTVNRRALRGISQLEELDLSSNSEFSLIDPGMFRGLLDLKKLNLSHNGINHLDLVSIFRSCQDLDSLDLSHNHLDHQTINEASMKENSFLKELYLAGNKLQNLEFLLALSRLKRLDVSENQIESIEAEGYNLLGRLVGVEHFDLRGNRIIELREETRNQLDHLFCCIANEPTIMNIQEFILKQLSS